MSRRKGTPCGCDADPCGCSPKNHCVKAINNVSPDPNGDLEIKAGNGIAISQSGDNEITIINDAIASSFVAGDNIEINPSGDDLEIRLTDNPVINGTLQVNGDIIQQGAAYETHAEKIYTTNDYIYMREGAVGGLASGSYAGFQVIKYDGTNDGRLVIDNTGTARVGDVGDEQPLMTREEDNQLTNGSMLRWDGVNHRAMDTGSVGSDTQPIKLVSGAPTPVTNELAVKDDLFFKQGDTFVTGSSFVYYGFINSADSVFALIPLPKFLNRPFTITVDSMTVCGATGSFTTSSNPIVSVTPNNQTLATIRLLVKFTNNHGLTGDRCANGFISYTLTVN
ncbi:MAG: hypothetical protein IKW89_00815 [Bacteroidales bacterium]|nr:hypothetical protein [Bacteroidales bacterium]